MGLNHNHLTYNKANIDLCCRAIWVLWVFDNNIDLSFASISQYCCLKSIKHCIALIIGPYLYNIAQIAMLVIGSNDLFKTEHVSNILTFFHKYFVLEVINILS